MRSRKAFVLRLRRITIRGKEKNQTFDEEISQPGERVLSLREFCPIKYIPVTGFLWPIEVKPVHKNEKNH